MVGAARVLDTGALLHLPPNRLSGGLVANSQREEIERVDKDRALLIEGVRLHWRSPSEEALQRAREAAQEITTAGAEEEERCAAGRQLQEAQLGHVGTLVLVLAPARRRV